MSGYAILGIIALVIILWIILKPYFIRYDTVCGFTGGLGSGKSFLSSLTAKREWSKNKIKTAIYNLFHRKKDRLPIPKLYSSIPVRIGKNKYSEVLTPRMLTLQERIVKGSVVYLDEVDVFANQYAYANDNIIEQATKKGLEKRRNNEEEYDSGLFDEYVRLFRHYWSSEACESKLIVNTQATSNIATIIRRRMNTVFVLSKFRIIKFPILHRLPLIGWLFKWYIVQCRNITITDEITNTAEGNTENAMRYVFGFVPLHRLYDTHCYRHRADTIPENTNETWTAMHTNRLLKCPIERLKNPCSYAEENKVKEDDTHIHREQ